MPCDEPPIQFGTSTEGLPLEVQFRQQRWRQALSEIGPEGWQQLAQICDALSIQLEREVRFRNKITHRLAEHGIPIPLPDYVH